MTEELARRIAVMVSLVERAPGKRLGRTAIMKLLYFLATLRNVDLGYRFSLYSYGPFDSEVLQDLDYAKNLSIISSRVVGYPSGYGYELEPGPDTTSARSFDARFLRQHESDLIWVINRFSRLSASDLELTSTIVYADREASGDTDINTLAQSVRDVKPHFSIQKISEWIGKLSGEGLLQSIH